MKSKNDTKRKKLYDVYSQNWELTKNILPKLNIKTAYEKGVICPLCFKIFNEEGLRQTYDDALTLEDIPPKKLGGKATILTCKICNNTSGYKLDSKLVEQRHVNSFLKGDLNSNVDVYVSFDKEFKTKGKLTIDSETSLFNFNLNNDKTKRTSDFLNQIIKRNDWDGRKMNFQFQEPSRRISQIAELRIAYLTAFSRLGYGLIFNNTYQPIRDQIKEPEKEILPSFGVLNPENITHDSGIFIVSEPKELKSILVIYKLKLENKTENRGVLIPGPGEDCLNFYKAQKELKTKINLKYTEINLDIEKINKEENAILPIEIWKKFAAN